MTGASVSSSSTYRLHREIEVKRPLDEVFYFFSNARNLELLTPGWVEFRVLNAPTCLEQGARIAYALRIHGIPVRWQTRIEGWCPPFSFVDVQEKGPYRLWRHTHGFRVTPEGTLITDDVEYAVPFGPLGRLAHRLLVRKDVCEVFDYRARTIAALFS